MKDKLDGLCEAFVMAEVGDRPALRALRHRVDDVLQDAVDARMVEALTGLGRTLDRLLAGADPDPDGSWKSVEETLLVLQGLAQVPAGAPPEIDADLFGGFVVEAREHLEAAEAQLLALEADPSQVEAIHTVFRAFHTIKGAASCLDLATLQALAHETENLLDLARKGAIPMSGVATDLVFDAVDAMKRLVTDVETLMTSGTMPAPDPAMDALLVRIRAGVGLPKPADLEPIAIANLDPEAPSPVAAPAEEKVPVKEPVRVDADRLDRLVNLIGELVIAESMVSQSNELRGLAAGGTLGRSLSQLDKITRELQEMGMSLRMVPVRPLFRKMARLARDVSHKLGKPIEFVTTGEEIEIDKAILNCVTDALVHILRNALDHGIEAGADERLRAGKPAAGRLELRASHREGSILIEVEDDGRGLDYEAILAKGIEKGIFQKGERPGEQEVFQLIFLPAFSTATVVTQLSGRGVGLDVVRTSVEALRGRIEVQSRRGRGTTFRLRLPLTLALIDGMVIRSGGERFVVPTLSITRLVRPGADQLATSLGRGEMLLLQDELVPLFRLGRLLDVTAAAEPTGSEVAVVVEDGGRRAALLADEVLGQQQIVIKGLGISLEGVAGISGGVILADGQVGLILDVPGLLARTTSLAERGAEVVGGSVVVRTAG
jgi:two-component system chemotaxis sensor kinase CheA